MDALNANGIKPSSRFSALNVFGKFGASSKPPRLPPKDSQFYHQLTSKSTVSLAPSHALSSFSSQSYADESIIVSSEGHGDEAQQPGQQLCQGLLPSRSEYDLSRSSSSSPTSPSPVPSGTLNPLSRSQPASGSCVRGTEMGALSLKKSLSKLSNSLNKRPRLLLRSYASRATLQSSPDALDTPEDVVVVDFPDATGVSKPYNVQHKLHIDEKLSNLPLDWLDQLKANGLKDEDILSTHSRRNRTTYLRNHPDIDIDLIRSRSFDQNQSSSISSCSMSPSISSPSGSVPPPVPALPHALQQQQRRKYPTRSSSLRRPQGKTSQDGMIDGAVPTVANSVRSQNSMDGSSFSHGTSGGRPSISSPSSFSPPTSTTNHGTSTLNSPVSSEFEHVHEEQRLENEYDVVSLSASLSKSRKLRQRLKPTFRVVNYTPPPPSPSSPPTYGTSDETRSPLKTLFTNGDSKASLSSNKRKSQRTNQNNKNVQSGLASGVYSNGTANGIERRSEETVTQEMLLRNFQAEGQSLNRSSLAASYTNSLSSPVLSNSPTLLSTSTSVVSSPSFAASSGTIFRAESTGVDSMGSIPVTPIQRTATLPPRLSLHQDIDSDLSSWSEMLFSVMERETSGLGNGIAFDNEAGTSCMEKQEGSMTATATMMTRTPPRTASTAGSRPPKSPAADSSGVARKPAPVPPLILSPPRTHSGITIEVEQTEEPPKFSPLYKEVMSLVTSTPEASEGKLKGDRDSVTKDKATIRAQAQTQAYQSTPPHNYSFLQQQSHSGSPPNQKFNSSRESDFQKTANSSRDSQMTIMSNGSTSTSDRWSHWTNMTIATREVTIAHACKGNVAMAVARKMPAQTLAASSSKDITNTNAEAKVTITPDQDISVPFQSLPSTVQSSSSDSDERGRELKRSMDSGMRSSASSPSSNRDLKYPSADDFPLPPPSPLSGIFSGSVPASAQASPLLGAFPNGLSGYVVAERERAKAKTVSSGGRGIGRDGSAAAADTASIRSSQSSTGSRSACTSNTDSTSSSSSSRTQPLSITSGSHSSLDGNGPGGVFYEPELNVVRTSRTVNVLSSAAARLGHGGSGLQDRGLLPVSPTGSVMSADSGSRSGLGSDQWRVQVMGIEEKELALPPSPDTTQVIQITTSVYSDGECDADGEADADAEAGAAQVILSYDPVVDIEQPDLLGSPAPGSDLSPLSATAAVMTAGVAEWLVEDPSPRYASSFHGSIRRDSAALDSANANETTDVNSSSPSPSSRSLGLTPMETKVHNVHGARVQAGQFLSPLLIPPYSSLAAVSANGVSTFSTPSRSPSPISSSIPIYTSTSTSRAATPRCLGSVSEIIAPLEQFIDNGVGDPRTLFVDMEEIAEGESGSVYAARVVRSTTSKNPKACSSSQTEQESEPEMVAIKAIPLMPLSNTDLTQLSSPQTKIDDLRSELLLLSHIRVDPRQNQNRNKKEERHENEHILFMDSLYLDLVDNSLWIRMELMERSLADVLGLSAEGLVLEQEVIARFAGDILSALAHLEDHSIAHRDVRSDNLLINSNGVLKLSDFSHALSINSASPLYSEPAGVVFWQAPEMRPHRGSSGGCAYDARKVDVWSAGATVWEMAEAEPPFMSLLEEAQSQGQVDEAEEVLSDRWPVLSRAEMFSTSFHEFLEMCQRRADERPSARTLLATLFVQSACVRDIIVNLLATCKAVEERAQQRQSMDA